MLLIDATIPTLLALGYNINFSKLNKWFKALRSVGVTRIRKPSEPAVALETLHGLDGVLSGDYAAIFRRLRRLEPLEVAFGDSKGQATALAISWLEEGGSGVIATLTGIGSFPALERLRVFLHLSGWSPLPESSQSFAQIREIYESLSGQKLPLFEPVLGRGLFVGESGVHVDGWLKDPSLYEPFPPNLVGAKRALAIGRHSGQGALRLKCWELGFKYPQEKLADLLALARQKATELERSLTDSEFATLAQEGLGGLG
ncbi:MAG: hypothetical protein LBI10_03205 [Deltaproteobacteria bacterium]|jgi:homocitrate synthase NifV|nr:hypothetical protein [Deltaproteobacteria bacterium]